MAADDHQHDVLVGRLTPGAMIAGGRYRVERLLGVWGVRAFYLAEAAPQRPRAILAEFAHTGGMAVAERAQRLMALDHPILPAVREYFQQGNMLYLALNLPDGILLEQMLPRAPGGQSDETQAIAWGIQLCDGLTYLQSQMPPIAVADLAPSAIFVTARDRIKLVGLGHMLGLYTTAGLVGALEQGYTAPEVYLGQLDVRADIYALGALLYRALSGSSPTAYTPGSLPPLWALRPAIAPELAAAVERAIAQQPGERWPDAATFGAELRQAAAVIASRGVAVAAAAHAEPPLIAPVAASAVPASLANVSATIPASAQPSDATTPQNPRAPAPAPQSQRAGFFARLFGRQRTSPPQARGELSRKRS